MISLSAYYISCCWQTTRNGVATHTQHGGKGLGGGTGGSTGNNVRRHCGTFPIAGALQTGLCTTSLLSHWAKNVQTDTNWNIETPSKACVCSYWRTWYLGVCGGILWQEQAGLLPACPHSRHVFRRHGALCVGSYAQRKLNVKGPAVRMRVHHNAGLPGVAWCVVLFFERRSDWGHIRQILLAGGRTPLWLACADLPSAG